MKEDWTEQLEDKLNHYSMAEPEGLWDALQSSLTEQPKAMPVKRPDWRKSLTIALPVSIAACLTLFLLLPSGNKVGNDAPVEVLSASVIPSSPEQTENIELLAMLAEETPNSPVRERITMAREHQVIEEKKLLDIEDEEPVCSEVEQTQSIGIETNTIARERVDEPEFEDWPYEEDKEGRRYPSVISFSAGGASGKTNAISMASAASSYQAIATPLRNSPFENAEGNVTKTELSDYDWNVSFKMSLIAEKYLTGRFSIGSGISWSQIEGKMQYELGKAQANYIGIPLILNYDLFKSRHFSLSATAGVTGALGIANSDKLNIKGFQLSTNLGANARYSLGRHLALQMGIGADTYYPTGAKESCVFKERTTVLNLNVGLLWSIR